MYVSVHKYGYGACGGAVSKWWFESLFSSSCETPQSNFVVVFYKAWPTDPIGSSQEPRLHATIAILGSVSSAQLLFRVHLISWEKDYVGCMTSYDPRFSQGRRCYDVSRASWKLLEEDVLEVTWRRCYDVSRASWKLLEEDVTTYQERLGSCLKKLFRRIKSVLEISWRRCCNVVCNVFEAQTPGEYLESSMESPISPCRPSHHSAQNTRNPREPRGLAKGTCGDRLMGLQRYTIWLLNR